MQIDLKLDSFLIRNLFYLVTITLITCFSVGTLGKLFIKYALCKYFFPHSAASREKSYKQIEAAIAKFQEIKENINEGLKFYVLIQV